LSEDFDEDDVAEPVADAYTATLRSLMLLVAKYTRWNTTDLFRQRLINYGQYASYREAMATLMSTLLQMERVKQPGLTYAGDNRFNFVAQLGGMSAVMPWALAYPSATANGIRDVISEYDLDWR
jgi:hypothetical protein